MNIGIISLGLIGGSILKALYGNSDNLYAVTRNKATIRKAKEYCSNISEDINILNKCDVVFVASPINQTEKMLKMLENVVSNNCIVLDCASVKEFVMKQKRPYKFIGSHPMAGTEFSGYDASFKNLFKDAKWVLTPSDNITKKEINTVKKIIQKMGAKTLIADAKEHDRAAALISHMPLLISQAIYKTASDNKLAMQLASSGFRDMTRLATSNLNMALDMMIYNRKNINKSLKELNSSIKLLKDTKDLKIFADIKNTRSKMYSKEGKNNIGV